MSVDQSRRARWDTLTPTGKLRAIDRRINDGRVQGFSPRDMLVFASTAGVGVVICFTFVVFTSNLVISALGVALFLSAVVAALLAAVGYLEQRKDSLMPQVIPPENDAALSFDPERGWYRSPTPLEQKSKHGRTVRRPDTRITS